MNLPLVKTYRTGIGAPAPAGSFFIQSHGLHAGRPLDHPIRNCFIVRCPDEETRNRLYWICFAYWQGRHYEPFIGGSVIPFITIRDFRRILTGVIHKVCASPHRAEKMAEQARKIHLAEQSLQRQALLMGRLKRAILADYFHNSD